MKYFTIGVWAGEGDFAEAHSIYHAYIVSVADLLPEGARTLISGGGSLCFADARLRHLDVDIPAGTVSLRFTADVKDAEQLDERNGAWKIIAHRLDLRYRSVVRLESTGDPRTGLPGPNGYGDFGFDEFEIREDGHVVHRLLFSNGIELHIAFKEMDIHLAEFPDSLLPQRGEKG